ncbi:MAG: adenylyl-sulfate kinase [Desulfurivibrio sp.]|nr:adenylyl-sulfate kinase [Desulfurivibrio sp.]
MFAGRVRTAGCQGVVPDAREGKIKNYTGVSAPYESPEQPDLTLETEFP